MKQYSCNNSQKLFNRYLPLIFILIAALAFSPIFSRLSSNIVIEGATGTAGTTTAEAETTTANAGAEASRMDTILANLREIQTANNNLTNIVEERNYILPKYLDTETTNARLDYTTLDVNSINMQLVLLSGVAIVIGIFIIIHLTQ